MNYQDNPAEKNESDDRFSRLNDFAWIFFYTKNMADLTLNDMAQKLKTTICRKYLTDCITESTDPSEIQAAKQQFLE